MTQPRVRITIDDADALVDEVLEVSRELAAVSWGDSWMERVKGIEP